MNIVVLFLIAISLSMDAFSLALAYGIVIKEKQNIKILSLIVGVYHFFMPILGLYFGNIILSFIKIDKKYITLIIFIIIGLNMILESFKDESNIKKLKLFEMFLFGFAVSIDSFSIGIGINNITKNYIFSALIFSLTSAAFTFLGLVLGNNLNKYIGKLSPIFGGIMLIILGIVFFIK